jgi:hypothetical protein
VIDKRKKKSYTIKKPRLHALSGKNLQISDEESDIGEDGMFEL